MALLCCVWRSCVYVNNGGKVGVIGYKNRSVPAGIRSAPIMLCRENFHCMHIGTTCILHTYLHVCRNLHRFEDRNNNKFVGCGVLPREDGERDIKSQSYN